MANGIYNVTEDFEEQLCKYTGAQYAVALDNMSNGLFLSLYYENKILERCAGTITIPSRTYPSVPCEIIHAGLKVNFKKSSQKTLKGAYQLEGSNVWDSALRFTSDMYLPHSHMCISFTGRYSGRRECSYHDDNLDMLGWNFYMMPELAARGLLLMNQFYNFDGSPKKNKDSELPYPDLSKFKVYSQ